MSLDTTNKFLEDLANAAQAADEASERLNFGKLTIAPSRYIQWHRDADGNYERHEEITAEQYRQLPKRDTSIEVLFTVDVKEFNPALEWEYERRVAIQIGKSDWQTIVKPSLVKLLGKKIAQDYATAFSAINGKYVQVADVPQVKTPDFNTIEFKKIYASRDECFQDWNARFGEGRSQASGASVPSATPSNVPDGYTAETFQSVLPTLKAELAKGTDPVKLAGDYMLTPKVIEDIKNGVYG